MKQKKKYIAIAVLCLTAILGLIGCLYAFGFRITYAPELENSWDAISACAAWAGVVMSFVAIMFAIWVPIRIANRQDKIALFEKRYEIYDKIKNYVENIEDRPFEFEYGWFQELSTSEKQINALFDDELGDFYNRLNVKSCKLQKLLGCYDHAERKGSCYVDNIVKTEQEIETDINDMVQNIKNDFETIKDTMYTKYLKL